MRMRVFADGRKRCRSFFIFLILSLFSPGDDLASIGGKAFFFFLLMTDLKLIFCHLNSVLVKVIPKSFKIALVHLLKY